MFEKFALFIHIIGAIGLFAGMALQLSSLTALRRATTIEQVRGIISGSSNLAVLLPVSASLILPSGLYLMYLANREHHDITWAGISLTIFIIVGAVANWSGNRDAKIIQTKVDESGQHFTNELRDMLQDTKFLTVPLVSVWTLSGVVALMVFKPDAYISVLVVAAAIAIGFANAALIRKDLLKL